MRIALKSQSRKVGVLTSSSCVVHAIRVEGTIGLKVAQCASTPGFKYLAGGSELFLAGTRSLMERQNVNSQEEKLHNSEDVSVNTTTTNNNNNNKPLRPQSLMVVGDTFVDVLCGPLGGMPGWGDAIVSPDPIRAVPGGCSLNVACNYVRMCGRESASLYTGIGSDAFGDIPKAHLRKIGVKVEEAESEDKAAPTGVCVVLTGPDDRSLVFHSGMFLRFCVNARTSSVDLSVCPYV